MHMLCGHHLSLLSVSCKWTEGGGLAASVGTAVNLSEGGARNPWHFMHRVSAKTSWEHPSSERSSQDALGRFTIKPCSRSVNKFTAIVAIGYNCDNEIMLLGIHEKTSKTVMKN